MSDALIDQVILTNLRTDHGMIESDEGYHYKTEAEAVAHMNGFQVGAKRMIEVYGIVAAIFIQDAIKGEYDSLETEELLTRFFPRWITFCGKAYNEYAEGENAVGDFSNAIDHFGMAENDYVG